MMEFNDLKTRDDARRNQMLELEFLCFAHAARSTCRIPSHTS